MKSDILLNLVWIELVLILYYNQRMFFLGILCFLYYHYKQRFVDTTVSYPVLSWRSEIELLCAPL